MKFDPETVKFDPFDPKSTPNDPKHPKFDPPKSDISLYKYKENSRFRPINPNFIVISLRFKITSIDGSIIL